MDEKALGSSVESANQSDVCLGPTCKLHVFKEKHGVECWLTHRPRILNRILDEAFCFALQQPTGGESKLRVTGGEDAGSSGGGVWALSETMVGYPSRPTEYIRKRFRLFMLNHDCVR